MDVKTPNQPVAVTLNPDTDDAVGIMLHPGQIWAADADVVAEYPQFFEDVEVLGKRGPGRPKKKRAARAERATAAPDETRPVSVPEEG